MLVADIFMMRFKGLPCFSFSERRDLCCHVRAPFLMLECWNYGIPGRALLLHNSIIPTFHNSSVLNGLRKGGALGACHHLYSAVLSVPRVLSFRAGRTSLIARLFP